MRSDDKPQGIAGLAGRVPIGARATVGRRADKGDNARAGTPINKDRFYLVMPHARAVEGVRGGIKPLHPAFELWNSEKAPKDKRNRLTGRLVHMSLTDSLAYRLKAQGRPRQNGRGVDMTPSRRPYCEGDGETAHRIEWQGEQERMTTIPCPHDACPLRQGGTPACKPWGELLFQLTWRDEIKAHGLPELLVHWSTGSWHTVRNLIGFRDHIEQTARELGMDSFPMMNFPIELTVQEATSSKDGGRRFPIVRLAPVVEPLSWVEMHRRQRHAAGLPERPVRLIEQDSRARIEAHNDTAGPGRHVDVVDPEEVDDDGPPDDYRGAGDPSLMGIPLDGGG